VPGAFQDQYPAPDAKYVSPETDIMLRPGGLVDLGALSEDDLLDVRGSQSGLHSGRLVVADDGETILFDPDDSFHPGESVQVRLRPGLRTSFGSVPTTRFSFTVSQGRGVGPISGFSSLEEAPTAAHDSLPSGFPKLTRSVTGVTAPGRIFLSDIVFSDPGYASYLMIVDDDGNPLFYRRIGGLGLDFKVQPDGRATYFDTSTRRYYALDASFAVIDSFQCGNGYDTDLHELKLLPNGHALLMAYDPQIVDMSQVVTGGKSDATVIGLVVQELDREKRVVFQWRSWDHFEITDATASDFTASLIDYAHGNSIEVDTDGNLIISLRHMDEVTKISRRNGKVIWRLGGKHNEFAFSGDPIGFSHQHDARRLANGDLSLFDNGFYHAPPFSRAAEYRLDETRKTATLVWEYRPTPSLIAFAMGSAQRLPNGNTLIGWGTASTTVTEVNPAGEKVTELSFPRGVNSYRAFRFEWPPTLAAEIQVQPNVLRASSRSPWVTASIRVPNVRPDQVDASTVFLGGIAAAVDPSDDLHSTGSGPGDAFRLRFSRSDLVASLHPGANKLELRGRLATGVEFHGSAEITLVEQVGSQRVSLVGNRTGGQSPIVLFLSGAVGGEYEVSIFDVKGALVRRWSTRLAEDTPVRWQGDASSGRPVSSGVYFVRVEGGATRALAKVVIAR
jgi:hypothetical protein